MRTLLLLASFALIGCTSPGPAHVPPVLLFTGGGTSANDVAAVEAILKEKHFEYSTATSRQLNGMSEAQLMDYRLIVVPGGNFIAMAESLTPGTTANIRNAVAGGLNYLGICAGAFLAARGTYNSVNLTSGVRFGFYAAERRGVRKAAVTVTGVGTPPIEHYWEDGPELTGWGMVVGTYPDGTPAIVEGPAGKGWVILTGVHPEAPDHWRRGMTFTMPARVANVYAGTLVEAALYRTSLPHY
ncbi:MAG: BPL-N domain-containing protein [bacterium]